MQVHTPTCSSKSTNNCEDVIRIYINGHICSIKHTHTHTHTHERLTTHIAVGPSVVRAGDLLVCRPSSYCRLFRLGWREEEEGAYREQRGRNERGREKCASLNTHTNFETSMYRVMCQQHQK